MEEPRGPLFSKKEKIIIISIFAILFLASIIVTAYLVSEGYPEDFGKYNIATIFLIIATIACSCFSYKHRHKGVSVYFGLAIRPTYVNFIKEKNFTYEAKFLRRHYIKILIFLAQVPVQLPLIVYVETIEQSFLSIFVYFVPIIIFAIMDLIVYNLPSVRKERKKLAEIKEREKREALQNRFQDRY